VVKLTLIEVDGGHLITISAGAQSARPATKAATAPTPLASHQHKDQNDQEGHQNQFIHLFSNNIKMLDITKIIAESLGTFVLMLAVLMFKNPVFIAVGFLLAIYASGDYSGGHINPAVSIAQVVKGDLPVSALPGYISAQLFGALAAVYVAKRLRRN